MKPSRRRFAYLAALAAGMARLTAKPAAKACLFAASAFAAFWLYILATSAMLGAASAIACSISSSCTGASESPAVEAFALPDGSAYATSPSIWDEFEAQSMGGPIALHSKMPFASAPVGWEGPLIHRMSPRIAAMKLGLSDPGSYKTPPWQAGHGTANLFFFGFVLQSTIFLLFLIAKILSAPLKSAALSLPAKAQSLARKTLEAGGLDEKLARAEAAEIHKAAAASKIPPGPKPL